MIEFELKNRRLRLNPDGVMYCRSHCRGKETKKETWREIKFHKSHGYDQCQISINGKQRNFFKHRLVKLAHDPTFDIFDSSPNNYIDHENRTPADNSNGNLRVVTNQQNQFNRSNTKGYYWDKTNKKWKAYITLNGKQITLGYFKTEEEAHEAYLAAKPIYHII